MDLYVVSGPYHLFESICLMLQENRGHKSFLVILDNFYGAEKLFNNILSSGIVETGWLMSKKEIASYSPSIVARLKRLIPCYRKALYHKMYSSSPIFDKRFDRIYIAGTIKPLSMFVDYSRRENYSAICIIDDGLGHRIGAKTPNLFQKIKRFINIDVCKMANYQMFFSPQLTADMYPYNRKVQQLKPGIEKIDDSMEFLDAMRNVLCAGDCDLTYDIVRFKKVKCMFLSNGFDAINNIEYAKMEENIINLCSEQIDEFVLKKHPLSQYNYSKAPIFDTILPLEMLFLYADIEKMLFISPISVSLFNPKFIMDKEPYVALVYKLVGIKNIASSMFYTSDSEFEKRIELSLLNAYRDKKRICIPETEEELIAFIDYWKRETRSTRLNG